MGEVNKRSHLKLVGGALGQPAARAPVQGVLFPETANALVYLVNMPAVTDDVFLTTLRTVLPSLVFDLRTMPSFSIGRLNRFQAFDLFEELGTRYLDVPGLVGAVSRSDARERFSAMAKAIVEAVQQSGTGPSRIMFLLDDPAAVSDAVVEFPRMLPERDKDPWQVRVVGGVRAS